jgi:MFS family permease
MPTLLVGRSIQGSGGGGIVALTLVVISDMVTLRERGKWISLNSAMWALGSVIGPVIGGAFAEKASWRWIFWFNIPFCVIGGIGIPICLKLQPKDGSILARLRQFDWIGSILFIASTSSFLIPITWVSIVLINF